MTPDELSQKIVAWLDGLPFDLKIPAHRQDLADGLLVVVGAVSCVGGDCTTNTLCGRIRGCRRLGHPDRTAKVPLHTEAQDTSIFAPGLRVEVCRAGTTEVWVCRGLSRRGDDVNFHIEGLPGNNRRNMRPERWRQFVEGGKHLGFTSIAPRRYDKSGGVQTDVEKKIFGAYYGFLDSEGQLYVRQAIFFSGELDDRRVVYNSFCPPGDGTLTAGGQNAIRLVSQIRWMQKQNVVEYTKEELTAWRKG